MQLTTSSWWVYCVVSVDLSEWQLTSEQEMGKNITRHKLMKEAALKRGDNGGDTVDVWSPEFKIDNRNVTLLEMWPAIAKERQDDGEDESESESEDEDGDNGKETNRGETEVVSRNFVCRKSRPNDGLSIGTGVQSNNRGKLLVFTPKVAD